VRRERSGAFAPGRVNLIGEHTDYNEGLALPFAITEGVTVRAEAQPQGATGEAYVVAHARDLDERDEFPLAKPAPAEGWRAFVRGAVAELARAGYPLVGARVFISGQVPRGAGMSSSAALEVALCLALIDLAGGRVPGLARKRGVNDHDDDVVEDDEQLIGLARVCARIEQRWVGAQTGLLDQLACLCGAPKTALRIDFRTLRIEPVALALGGWRLVVLDSGQSHALASSGYNARRAECARACRLLGVRSLRDTDEEACERLPEPLRRRAAHVLSENRRVCEVVAALKAADMPALGALLDASHASLREDYEVSTPAVEATVRRLLDAGAAGARVIGGGFGGSVLGLLAPDVGAPPGAREVRPGPGAHLLA
jgi:galactokinase